MPIPVSYTHLDVYKRQISTLYDSVPGEAGPLEDILSLKKEIEDAGLQLAGIESCLLYTSRCV